MTWWINYQTQDEDGSLSGGSCGPYPDILAAVSALHHPAQVWTHYVRPQVWWQDQYPPVYLLLPAPPAPNTRTSHPNLEAQPPFNTKGEPA